jgi:hypothetical protein
MFTPFAFVQTVGSAGPSYQPLTTAFAAASGISDATTLNSLNAFEIGLTAFSISTGSFYAIYPFVGASSGSMKWNFVNTTQYNLTYSGSLTFTTGGIQAAGSPKLGAVGSVPANMLSTASGHHFFYVTDPQSPTGGACCESNVGATGDINDSSLTQYYSTWFRSGGNGNLVYPCDNATTAGNGSITPNSSTAAKGSYCLSRTSVSSMKAWYNGTTSRGTNTTTLTNRNYRNFTRQVNFLSRDGTNSATTCQQRMGWASIGFGLTDTEVSNYNTLVTNFQTSMSRA